MQEPTLSQKISLIKNIIRGKVCKLNYFDFYEEDDPCMVYPFYATTNENLNYLPEMTSFEDKEVLVPTASGDHALNSILLGARSVETFDINSIAKHHYDVKENAIKLLSRQEFVDFYSHDELLGESTYQKIRPLVKEETREFFDKLFEILDEHKTKINTLVEDCFPVRNDFVHLNPYLKDEKTYKTLQEKLLNMKTPVTHKICPAHEIDKNFDKKDILILSNIFSAYYGFDKNVQTFLRAVPKTLKNGGVASINYIYGSLNKFQKYFLCKKIERNFDNVETKHVDGNEEKQKDLVLITRTRQL